MKNDSVIKSEGYCALFEKLGPVDAERFLMLLSRERQGFDYTEWRRGLWAGENLTEVASIAKKLERQALERRKRKNLA
jgi:hypothetical protein